MSDLSQLLLRNHLTTAEIIYRLPDHPDLLQLYVWQDIDTAPRFPKLARFLHFWETSIEGKLHRVRIASAALVQPAEFRFAQGEFRLN